MKHTLPPLDSLKAFESAARHLSFSLAANELCITKGAISYQIRKLEESIQCTLFKRSVRQVYLTDEGQTLYQSTKQVFQELDNTFNKLQEVKQNTDVSIAATTYVAARWLSSRISRFNEDYPAINIMLQHSINTAGFKLDDADLTIMWGPCSGRLDKHRFAEIPIDMFPVISPKILKAHNLNPSSDITIDELLDGTLSNVPLLSEDKQTDRWQEWFDTNKPAGKDIKLTNPRRIITDANVRVQAAIDGQGIIIADHLMSSEINNGLLVAPFKEKLVGYGYAFYASSTGMHLDNVSILKEWFVKNI